MDPSTDERIHSDSDPETLSSRPSAEELRLSRAVTVLENRPNQDAYRATVVALLEHGATVKHEWIDDDRLRQDSELWKLLRAAEVTAT